MSVRELKMGEDGTLERGRIALWGRVDGGEWTLIPSSEWPGLTDVERAQLHDLWVEFFRKVSTRERA